MEFRRFWEPKIAGSIPAMLTLRIGKSIVGNRSGGKACPCFVCRLPDSAFENGSSVQSGVDAALSRQRSPVQIRYEPLGKLQLELQPKLEFENGTFESIPGIFGRPVSV